MKKFNVVLVTALEWEAEIQADNEEQSKAIAEHFAQDRPIENIIADSQFSTTLPEAVEAWEID